MNNWKTEFAAWLEEQAEKSILRGFAYNRHIHEDSVKAFIERLLADERKRVVGELAVWIDDNVGVSSEALFLYMAAKKHPRPFDAPGDAGDRGRCAVLLKAIPEWIPRLGEIEALKISGTSNGVIVYPWNEQIPLIRDAITKIQDV